MHVNPLTGIPFILIWVIGAMISIYLSKDQTTEIEKLCHIVNGFLFGYIITIGLFTFYLSEIISKVIIYFKNRRDLSNV